MKRLLLILLLANAAVFGYGYYRQTMANSSPESELLKPINPDSIKILTPQQVARLGTTHARLRRMGAVQRRRTRQS
jgi:uncharacterized membrane protein YpjA